MESISELQEVEAGCIRRFRQKAAEIKAQHPELSAQVACALAVTALPKTADRVSGVPTEPGFPRCR